MESRNVIREYSIFINSFVLMGSGMSNIKTDILIETIVYIEISNKILDPHLKYGSGISKY